MLLVEGKGQDDSGENMWFNSIQAFFGLLSPMASPKHNDDVVRTNVCNYSNIRFFYRRFEIYLLMNIFICRTPVPHVLAYQFACFTPVQDNWFLWTTTFAIPMMNKFAENKIALSMISGPELPHLKWAQMCACCTLYTFWTNKSFIDHVIRERKKHNLTYPLRYDRAYQWDRWIPHSALVSFLFFLPVRCLCLWFVRWEKMRPNCYCSAQHGISFEALKYWENKIKSCGGKEINAKIIQFF